MFTYANHVFDWSFNIINVSLDGQNYHKVTSLHIVFGNKVKTNCKVENYYTKCLQILKCRSAMHYSAEGICSHSSALEFQWLCYRWSSMTCWGVYEGTYIWEHWAEFKQVRRSQWTSSGLENETWWFTQKLLSQILVKQVLLKVAKLHLTFWMCVMMTWKTYHNYKTESQSRS